MSISERMEARFGSAARHVTTVLLVWYLTALAGSQMVAAGEFLRTVLGTSYLAGLGLAALIVVVYSGAGGFLSVVKTHVAQFLLLVAGTAALIVSLARASSWSKVVAAAGALGRTGYVDFFAGAGRNVLVAMSFVLAWTISPIAWQRIQAARGVREARRGLAAAAVALGLFYAGIVLAGMLFLPLFGEGHVSGPLVSEYLRSRAGAALAGLLFVTVLAAIFSTMDAAINAGAFSLARELAGLRRTPGAAGQVLLARLTTLAVGAGAFLVATRFQDILRTLGLAAKIMAEGFFVPGVAALLLKKREPAAGLLSLAAGGGFAVLSFLAEAGLLPFLRVPPWPWSLPLGLALSGGGFGLGLLAGRLRSRRRRLP